jgi:hypothetical protein
VARQIQVYKIRIVVHGRSRTALRLKSVRLVLAPQAKTRKQQRTFFRIPSV